MIGGSVSFLIKQLWDMKTCSMPAYFLSMLFLVIGCGKGNGPSSGGTTKSWLVKDLAVHGGCAVGGSASVLHATFTYDDEGRIIRFDNSGCSTPTHYDVLYNSQGKISNLNFFQGNLSGVPNWIVTYQGDFVHTAFPANNDTAHYPGFTYNWNINGNQELDDIRFSKTSFGSGGTISYVYSLNALQSSYSVDDIGRKQDLWASFAPNLTDQSIPNPFQAGRSPEQKFLYYFLLLSIAGDWNVLGNSLPNGVYESYSYQSGDKKPVSHFFNKYSLDSNQNVSEITTSQSFDAPGFNTYTPGFTADITYEQH
jgi:hypothetical protein